MRLIDADALTDEIKHITGQDTIMWFDDRNINRAQEVNMAVFIELAPTIDPVKYGKWIKLGAAKYRCGECGKVQYGDRGSDLHFCCNCGARMDR